MASRSGFWSPVLVVVLAVCHSVQCSLPCVNDCEGVRDGSYQSCEGCGVYVSCEHGTLRQRPCPTGLVWDDFQKSCQYISSSCWGGAGCVSACLGLPDGFYQDCDRCYTYVQCHTEMLHLNLACPEGTVWDDQVKDCGATSSTCDGTPAAPAGPVSSSHFPQGSQEGSTPDDPSCVSSCEGQLDGHYQSCLGCNMFVSCMSGLQMGNRGCTYPLQWDDNLKRCDEASSTCILPTECVDSCVDRPDGEYHSCYGCHVFASCSNGELLDGRPCPRGLMWDDNVKGCLASSATCSSSDGGEGSSVYPTITTSTTTPPPPQSMCNCVGSCDGLLDGHYQSCRGCEYFATCYFGMIRDGIPCRQRKVWDDTLKRCVRESTTCYSGCENVLSTAAPCTCVDTCTGLQDGYYQSCTSCRSYVSCRGGHNHNTHYCPLGQLWDDLLKRCDFASSSCDPTCFNDRDEEGGGEEESQESEEEDVEAEEDEDGAGGSDESEQRDGRSAGTKNNNKNKGKSNGVNKGKGTSRGKGKGKGRGKGKGKGKGKGNNGGKNRGNNEGKNSQERSSNDSVNEEQELDQVTWRKMVRAASQQGWEANGAGDDRFARREAYLREIRDLIQTLQDLKQNEA